LWELDQPTNLTILEDAAPQTVNLTGISGGTANGGVGTSVIHSFTITIGESYQIYLPTILGA
jgi:hypothetical protein